MPSSLRMPIRRRRRWRAPSRDQLQAEFDVDRPGDHGAEGDQLPWAKLVRPVVPKIRLSPTPVMAMMRPNRMPSMARRVSFAADEMSALARLAPKEKRTGRSLPGEGHLDLGLLDFDAAWGVPLSRTTV